MKKINISTKKYSNKFALVDDDMFDYLNQWKWHFDGNRATRRLYLGGGRKNNKGRKIYMHRVINNTPDAYETDHRDRNPLNNQRYNLRTVTGSLNQHNVGLRKDNISGYKGVIFHKATQKWLAKVRINNKVIHLGVYNNIEYALLARKWGEKMYWEDKP